MGRLARATLLQFGVNIFRTAIGAIVTIYFVNLLGAATFGGYVLVLAIINWLRIPSMAVRSAVVKRVSEGTNRRATNFAGLILQIAISLVVALGIFALRSQINEYVGIAAAGWVLSLYIFINIADHYGAIIQAEERFEVASLIDAGRSVLRSGIQLVLVMFGGGVAALLTGELVATIVALAVGIVVSKTALKNPSKEEFQSLYSFARYSWLGSFKQLSYSWVDTLILGFIVGNAVIGAYEVAWRISILFVLLPQALNSILHASISSRTADGELDEARQLFGKGLMFAAGLAIPGTVGALILGKQILAIYGTSVTAVSESYVVLVLLCAGRIAESFEILLTGSLEAIDYPDRAFRISGLFISSNIFLNLIFASLFGAIGAAFATAVSVTLANVYAWAQFPSWFDVTFPIRTVTQQLLAALVMGGALLAMISFTPARRISITLVYVALGGAIYTLTLFALSAEMRDQIDQALHEIRDAT